MFQLSLCQKKVAKKPLEQLIPGFKRTIKWNKYRPQMTIQSNNNNVKYLTDPKFTNINRLFFVR